MRVSRPCEPALAGRRPVPRVAGRVRTWAALLLVAGLGLGTVTDATAEYWNLFNIEGESSIGAGADILPSIPEPSTIALMLAGMVGMIVALRRRI